MNLYCTEILKQNIRNASVRRDMSDNRSNMSFKGDIIYWFQLQRFRVGVIFHTLLPEYTSTSKNTATSLPAGIFGL